MKISIREYSSMDKDECMEAFKTNVPKFFSDQEVLDFADFLERIEKGIDDIPFYVLNYRGKVIGCGGYAKNQNSEVFTLAWGLIHNDLHKKGFGEKLLSYRLQEIKRLYKNSSVIVDTTQHSAGFFEKYGFITKKETKNYYAQGMHRIDMELKNS